MKYFILLLAVPALLSENCGKKKKRAAFPACVQQKIDSIVKEPRWNPPAEVNEYSYKGERVFLFSSDCCDFFDVLVDESCNPICGPHGGITGRGDGNCTDFDKEAQHIQLIWKDSREK